MKQVDVRNIVSIYHYNNYHCKITVLKAALVAIGHRCAAAYWLQCLQKIQKSTATSGLR